MGLLGGTELIAIYDVLVRYDREQGKWVPHAAKSLDSNADFTVWTLKLRPEVKYANGETMTAEHVLGNVKRLMGPGRNGVRGVATWVDLDTSKVVDDTTVEFHLVKPWSNFGYLLAEAGGVVPNPTLAAKVNDKGVSVIGTDTTGAGAGPYTVERYAPGESPYLVLRAKQDYWGGAPCIETINFLSIPADGQKLDTMESGESDVVFLRSESVIEDARAKGYEELTELQSSGNALLINNNAGTHSPITSDVKFRQAVGKAIDPIALKDRAYDGALLTHGGLLHPDSRYFTPGSPAFAYDLEGAKKLVEELKQTGWDGSVRLLCNNIVGELPVLLESMLELAGMTVESTVTDVNTLVANVAVQHDFDIACFGISLGDSVLWRLLGAHFYSTALANRTGYANPKMDAAIDALFAAADEGSRRDALATINEIVVEDAPFVPIAAVTEGIFVDKKVHGIVPTEFSTYLVADARIAD